MLEDAKLMLLATVVCALWALPSAAQEPLEAPRSDLVREVAGIQRSLERVAGMLEQLIEHQKTDLLLKRIEMRERRLAPLESELRQVRGDLAASKAELDRLESLKRDWGERLREAARTDESAAIELREMQSHFEQAHGTQTSRHQSLEQRVRTLEDDLAEGREQLEDLEAILLERLGQ